MSSSFINGLYQSGAMEEALRQVGAMCSVRAAKSVRFSPAAPVPLDAQSDLGQLIPVMTRICASVSMPFRGDVRGVTQVLFTERMALFFHDHLVAESRRGEHHRFVEIDVALEAGQMLLAPYWEAALGEEAAGRPLLRFDAPVFRWGSAETHLGKALRHAVTRAYVLSCECGGEYVDEWMLVQSASSGAGAAERNSNTP